MGWRIAPTPLKLPLPKRSERKVPPWGDLGYGTGAAESAAGFPNQTFRVSQRDQISAQGSHSLDSSTWSAIMEYRALLPVLSTFPDLRYDALLAGPFCYSLEKQRSALESQREHGAFIHQLIGFCNELLRRVQTSPAFLPSPSTLACWLQRPLRTQNFGTGQQAIEWTIDDRGLAGMSDLEGITVEYAHGTVF